MYHILAGTRQRRVAILKHEKFHCFRICDALIAADDELMFTGENG